jgi:hypothetical protein
MTTLPTSWLPFRIPILKPDMVTIRIGHNATDSWGSFFDPKVCALHTPVASTCSHHCETCRTSADQHQFSSAASSHALLHLACPLGYNEHTLVGSSSLRKKAMKRTVALVNVTHFDQVLGVNRSINCVIEHPIVLPSARAFKGARMF